MEIYEYDKVTLTYMEKGNYQNKFDLTGEYQVVEMHSAHTKYLGFAWPDQNGDMTYYNFFILPFGMIRVLLSV